MHYQLKLKKLILFAFPEFSSALIYWTAVDLCKVNNSDAGSSTTYDDFLKLKFVLIVHRIIRSSFVMLIENLS